MVYVVMEVCDYEYGCEEINSVWDSYESANNYISSLNNEEITFYDGHKQPRYAIDTWEVRH